MGLITKLNMTLECGLGAQMSQYASLYAISKKTNLIPVFIKEAIDRGFGFMLDKPFKNKPKIISINDIKTENFINYQIEPTDENIKNLDKNINYLLNCDLGLYHYYDEYRNDIIDLFTFEDNLIYECTKFMQENLNEGEIPVSITFRRGDYLTVASLNLTLEYYYEALEKLKSILPHEKFKYFIFSGASSGDPGYTWVRENFKLENCVYTENMDKNKHLCLTSLCHHNIIANSSFPWWAAYLNKNKNKIVICPKNYVNDVRFNDSINGKYYPPEWIAIDRI